MSLIDEVAALKDCVRRVRQMAINETYRRQRLERLLGEHHAWPTLTPVPPGALCPACTKDGYFRDYPPEHWQPVASGGTR